LENIECEKLQPNGNFASDYGIYDMTLVAARPQPILVTARGSPISGEQLDSARLCTFVQLAPR
jgi:hypothetical protein